MELKRRILRVNTRGDDVGALQAGMQRLGFKIDDDELKELRFGKTTSHAVRQFQEAYQLESTGEVDEASASLIHELLIANKHFARGAIRGIVLSPPEVNRFGGVRIEAFADTDLKQHVGWGISNERGQFVIVPDSKYRTSISQLPQLWFQWTSDGTRFRTPRLDPWLPGKALRLPLYEHEPGQSEQEITKPSSLGGRVMTVSGSPAAGLRVWLVEQSLQNCQHIASSETDANGLYRLTYDPTRLLQGDRSDLRYLVFDADGVALKESDIAEITVPDRYITMSWTKDLVAKEAFQIAHKWGAAQPFRPEDVDYLIRREGISGRVAALLRRATTLSRNTNIEIPIALAVEAAGPGVSLADVVGEGVSAGLLDPDILPDVGKLETIVVEQEDRSRRKLAADQGPLQDMLEGCLPDEALRLDTTRIWLEVQRDPEEFFNRLQEHTGLSLYANEVRFTVEVAEAVERNLELVYALERCFDTDDRVQKPEDLAAWDIPKWQALIEAESIAVPESFQGEGENGDSARKFAVYLRNKFERIYPGRAIREHFQRNASSYKWGEAVRTMLEGTEFDPSVPVPKLERENPDLFKSGDAQLARHGLATFQRLYRLTGNIEPIQSLVQAGFGSARAIAQTDPEAFKKHFNTAFSDNGADAAVAHARATRIASLAKLTYYEFSDRFNREPLSVFSSSNLTDQQSNTLATWRDLFGSEDLGFCECAQCKSIFGPAAYLFDMLLFLDRFEAPPRDPGVYQRVRRVKPLTFLNCVQEAEQIVDWVQDDPTFLVGPDRTWGVSLEVANMILQERQRQGGRFTSLQQVLEIDGVGLDTLHDIIHTSWGAAGPLAVYQALQFINTVTSADEIHSRIKDDPEYQLGEGLGIGIPLYIAERIIEYRDSPEIGGVFTSLSQVEAVPGIGPDTLHDIIFSFYETASQLTDIPWVWIGSAPETFRAFAVNNWPNYLIGIDANNRYWMRAEFQSSWNCQNITFNSGPHEIVSIVSLPFNNILASLSTGGLLRGFNIGGGLSFDQQMLDAPNVKTMSFLNHMLYAVTSDDRLMVRAVYKSTTTMWGDNFDPDAPWEELGQAAGIRTLAGISNLLFGVTDDNKLLMRNLSSQDASWIHVGEGGNVVLMSIIYGSLVGLTSDGNLWMRGISEELTQWEKLSQWDNRTLLYDLRMRRPDIPALALSCDNTNIEVPHIDLVNELLSDFVGESICFGMIQNAASLRDRCTTGTSEERRAWPEYEPPEVVLSELATAAYSWTLPYDYKKDRADQVRAALSIDGYKVVEALYAFEGLSREPAGVLSESPAWLVARCALDLTDAELDLIANPAPNIQKSWGDEVSGMITSGMTPSLAALERAGRFNFASLEDALETQFVRRQASDNRLAIRPACTCDTEQLYLDAQPGDIPDILDALHRFERLRRKIGWNANQLDNVLAAANLEFNEETLLIVGLLVYLQDQLKLDPDAVLALFQDPVAAPPFTLRPDKRVLSPFQRLFGTEPVELPASDGEDANDINIADSIVATIAQRVGVGHDEVRFVLSQGFAAFDGTILADPLAILDADDSLAAWQAAVASVFRVTTFASALKLSLTDFVALVKLSDTAPIPGVRAGVVMKELVMNAVSLTGLAHEASNWPISPLEVLYLATPDATAKCAYAPDSEDAETLLQNLQSETRRISETCNTAGEQTAGAVRDLLAELLGRAGNQMDSGNPALRTAIDRMCRSIEWSSVFPDLKAEAIASLPPEAVLESEVPDPDADEESKAGNTLTLAYTLLPDLVSTHIEEIVQTSGVDKTSPEYQNVLHSLENEMAAAIREPRSECVERFAEELQPLLELIGVPGDEIAARSQEIAGAVLPESINVVTDYRGPDPDSGEWYAMESVRAGAALRWLPAISKAAKRQKVDSAAVELLARAYSLDRSDAGLLLTEVLQDPDDSSHALLRAFVTRDGSTACKEDENGVLVPVQPEALIKALIRFDKAARLVRALSLPAIVWPLLAVLSDDRCIDLNGFPIENGNAFDMWRKIIALENLWKRHSEESDFTALQAIVDGSSISLESLAHALGRTEVEFQSVLRLFEVTLESDQGEVSFPFDWLVLDAALRLSDFARQAGMPLAAILGWVSAPADDFYRWALGGLCSLRPEKEWLEVLQHVHDPVREHLRDALVAWLVTHPRLGSSGEALPPFATPEAISDYLFTDVQMSACMTASRVQFGFAAIQRYIDRIRLGFEPGPEEANAQERFEREWSWRRFYRLWEANRRVFVYPENWLEPDLRPDKSQFFQELEDELLEGPLTKESAERALVNYLGKLVEVARPEIVGIIHQDEIPDSASPIGFRDPDLQGTHVFARSRSQPHQLYYRRRSPALDFRWTPWERIDAELPGTHFVPVVAFQRLFLICADFGFGKSEKDSCEQQLVGESEVHSTLSHHTANVVLSWIERRHGNWSHIHRSEPLEFRTPQVSVRKSGLDSAWDDDFPFNDFPDVSYSEEVLINKVEISITFGNVVSGRAPVMSNPNSSLMVNLMMLGNDIYVGPIAGISTGRNNQKMTLSCETGVSPFSFVPFNATDLKGIRFSYSTPQATSGPGDVCIIKKIEWKFQSDNNQVFADDVEAADDKTGLVILANAAATGGSYAGSTIQGDNWHQDVAITPPEQLVQWRNENVREYFEVEVVAEYSPRDAYALHAEPPSTQSNGPLTLHLVLAEGIKMHIAGKPRFRFLGQDQFPAVVGEWPSVWVDGIRESSRCIEGTTRLDYLLSIELFSDGTVRSSSQEGDEYTRGTYNGTTPWRQFFRAEALSSKPFDTGGIPLLTAVKQPYQLSVPNVGLISNEVGPKILDEISTLNDGRTLFVEYISNLLPMGGNWECWAFRAFWHPQAVGFLRLLQAYGVPRLLAYEAQTLADSALYEERRHIEFFQDYHPISVLDPGLSESLEYPRADVDFSVKGAYADYNWELFFHAPLLIAQRLSEAGQFEDAERWFRLLFDPTKGRLNQNPVESFQTRPLRDAINRRFEDMLYLLDDQGVRSEFEEQVDRLNNFPYQPHLIARWRLSAYQKMLVMKYLDHLIAWGDELFRRTYATDNRTELVNAASRYDFVAQLLGPCPELLPSLVRCVVSSYDALSANREVTDLWDPLIRMEDLMPRELEPSVVANDGEGVPELLYFCVPPNREMLEYWDKLADRLTNLRTCRDIEGVQRVLSLYGRQIDPGLLVRATALGLDIDMVLGYLAAPTPRFRFNVLLQRAKGACDRAQSFGQSLLAAIEKRESEELSRLRSKNELVLLRASKAVRDEQVDEARESLAALFKSRGSAEARYQYYSTRQRLNRQESAEGEALQGAAQSEQIAGEASSAAADRALIPNFPASVTAGARYDGSWNPYFEVSAGVNYDFGGRLFSNIEQQKASRANYEAGRHRAEAGRLARQAQYDRRWEDWQLQKDLAQKDIEQIDKQIASAQIRLRITEIEQENQLLQIDQSATVDAYLRDKFTNAKLYRWMESRLSRLYYQQYRLAYDLALKAQYALRYELGLDDNSLLPDTWDPERRGMESATDLQHELEKMETRYLDAWRREHEKQKSFSLLERWPLAFLELRQTGRCIIRILESDLDEDEPGDYFRRIKRVSVDIPCVRGPYVSVNARLTLLRSETRIKPYISGNYMRTPSLDGVSIDNFRDDAGGVEHIVTSTGMNDTGQFDPNLGGEKLLPFEGAGVISTWQIDLPIETNRFARSSISDVVLHIMYTARDGGNVARVTALGSRQDNSRRQGRSVMLPLTTYFSTAWSKFTSQQSTERELKLKLEAEHLPYGLQDWTVCEATFYFEVELEEDNVFDTNLGTPDWPLDLPGIARLALERPISLGEEFSLTTFASESGIFKKGWVLLLMKSG